MIEIKRAALYARFSSDNQRTESIDAQLRAMRQFCNQNKWKIVKTYVDEAYSATTDHRPDFQRMIEDSGKGLFDIVLVHKLESIIVKYLCEKSLCSNSLKKLKQKSLIITAVMKI